MTILIIDDEPIIRRGLSKMIAQVTDSYHNILQAENAQEALTIVQQTPAIDVIFADINLPDMNGLDLVAKLKKRCPEALVVIISGYDDFSYTRQAIHLGVVDYLLKPVVQSEMRELLLKIASHAPQTSQLQPPQTLSSSNLCNQAALYLSQHYAKKELSLSMVAASLFVDTSYLSKQMKQHLGHSFNEYLAHLRIEKAKELLLVADFDATIQEIGEKVGYPNQHYFSRIFKQYTGLSPSLFRQPTPEATI